MKRDVLRGARRPRRRLPRGGFTLTELLVVVGLIAVLLSLLLPVVARVRSAANGAACLSNLRQMTVAWTMYLTESRGRLPEPAKTYTAIEPEVAWRGYWPGILDGYRVRGDSILCPAADEPIAYEQEGNHKGFGNVNYAWNGRLMSPGVVKLNEEIYRTGSYAYNGKLTSEGSYANDGRAKRINAIRHLGEVPVFVDATGFDVEPINGTAAMPVQSPPDLRGDSYPIGAPQHWRFLIARHGRAVNVAFADGSARRVPLEETYQLRWAELWQKYTLTLPPF